MAPPTVNYLGSACRLFHGTSIPFVLDAGTYRFPLGLDGGFVDTGIGAGEEEEGERLRGYLRENARFFVQPHPEPRVFGSLEEFRQALRPAWLDRFREEVDQTIRKEGDRDVIALLGLDFSAFVRERWEAMVPLLGAILYMDIPSVSSSYQLGLFDLVLYGPTPPERGLAFFLKLSLLGELCSTHIFLRSGMIPKVSIVDSEGGERALYDPWPDLAGNDFSIVSVAADGAANDVQYIVHDSDRPRVLHSLGPDGEIVGGRTEEAVTEAAHEFQTFLRDGVGLFLGWYLFLHYELTRAEVLRLAGAAVPSALGLRAGRSASQGLQEAIREIRPAVDEREAETAARWLMTPLRFLLQSGRVNIALELTTVPPGRN